MAYAPPQIPTFKSKFYLILSPQTLRNAALKKQKKKKRAFLDEGLQPSIKLTYKNKNQNQ